MLPFRTPAVEYFTSTLAEVGFKIGGLYALLDELLIKPEVYMQKDGPFDEKWRNMDRYCACSILADVSFANLSYNHQI